MRMRGRSIEIDKARNSGKGRLDRVCKDGIAELLRVACRPIRSCVDALAEKFPCKTTM